MSLACPLLNPFGYAAESIKTFELVRGPPDLGVFRRRFGDGRRYRSTRPVSRTKRTYKNGKKNRERARTARENMFGRLRAVSTGRDDLRGRGCFRRSSSVCRSAICFPSRLFERASGDVVHMAACRRGGGVIDPRTGSTEN